MAKMAGKEKDTMNTKKMSIILVLIMVLSIVAPAFAAQQPIGTITVPMNGSSLYRVDPDNEVKTIRNKKVTIKDTVAPFASNGLVTGSVAKQHVLQFGFETNKVRIYEVTTLNASLIPEEARNLDSVAMANYFIALCTRVELGGTCLNVEPYNSKVHTGVINIQVGTKKAQYWTVFYRNDGVWLLCTKGKNGSKPTTQPTEQPTVQPTEQPTATPTPVDPEPVWETPDPTAEPTPAPTEEPWDPEFVWEDPTPAPTAEPTHDVDPTPIWEEEDPTPAPTAAPTQSWDEDFNLDPEPQWEDEDPTPAPTSAPTVAPTQDVDPAPVFEDDDPAPQPAPEPTQDWDADFNFSATQAPAVATPSVQADPEAVWEDDPAPAPAPAAPQAAPEPEADPGTQWEDDEPAPQSQPDPGDGWDADFNF